MNQEKEFSDKIASFSYETIKMISDLAKKDKELFYKALKIAGEYDTESKIVLEINQLSAPR